MATSSQNMYIDPWQEYRWITSKLKKRFLRKPNISEALRDFVQLSNRLKDEECPHYAGYCHLAIARCEFTDNKVSGEIAGLKQAARFFMEAECDQDQLGLPTFHENLATAVHCYGHAIKTHVFEKQFTLAGSLCLELGLHLYRMDRPSEAVEYFEKAAKYFENEPFNKTFALESLALSQAESDQFTASLSTIDQLWSFTLKLSEPHGVEGVIKDILRTCEIATVLLLLLLRTLPKHMSDRHSALMQMYTWISDPGEPLPPETFLSGENFLLLQSLLLAVQWREAQTADHCLTKLLPTLSPFLCFLGLDLVDKLYTGDYVVD